MFRSLCRKKRKFFRRCTLFSKISRNFTRVSLDKVKMSLKMPLVEYSVRYLVVRRATSDVEAELKDKKHFWNLIKIRFLFSIIQSRPTLISWSANCTIYGAVRFMVSLFLPCRNYALACIFVSITANLTESSRICHWIHGLNVCFCTFSFALATNVELFTRITLMKDTCEWLWDGMKQNAARRPRQTSWGKSKATERDEDLWIMFSPFSAASSSCDIDTTAGRTRELDSICDGIYRIRFYLNVLFRQTMKCNNELINTKRIFTWFRFSVVYYQSDYHF